LFYFKLKLNETFADSFNTANQETSKQLTNKKEDEANGFVIVSDNKEKNKESEIENTTDVTYSKTNSNVSHGESNYNDKKNSYSTNNFNEKSDVFSEKLNILSHNRSKLLNLN
jgi:hypothetical protein